MRNLKRALSLALASVMVLGLMVVGSSAKGYDDVTSEENVEAIEVLQAVGIMTGDDNGNFNPTQNVTRNEMAVIMSNLMDYRVATYKGTSPFTDVPEWAEPYVAACYTNGIIAGYSATTFGGSDPVVTSQATLMILKALGYFKYASDFSDDWQLATINQAGRIDLLEGVESAVRVPMTRNDVAQLVLNGLEAGTVEPDTSNKMDIVVGDTQITTGTKYNFVTSGRDYAFAINQKLDTNNNGQYSAGAIVELGEKLYQGDLTKEGIPDALGRPSTVWEFKTKEIGTYADTADYEWSKKVTAKTLYNAVGKAATETYTWNVYVDGVLQDFSGSKLNAVKTDDDKCFLERAGVAKPTWGYTGNGAVTQVFVNSTMADSSTLDKNDNGGRTVTVAIAHYWAAEVYKVNEDVETIQLSGFYGPVKTTDDFTTDDFAEDEIVMYSYSEGTKSIQEVYTAERIEGQVSRVRSNTGGGDETNGDNFALDDENYSYNMTMDSKDHLLIENVNNDMVGYTDRYGYCAYIDESAVTYDYAYVLSMGTDNDTYGNQDKYGSGGSSAKGTTVYARLVLADGTIAKVQTNVKISDVGGGDYDSRPGTPTIDDAICMYLNHIVSYTKGSDGVYSLSLRDVDHSTAQNKNISGTGAHGLTTYHKGASDGSQRDVVTGIVPVSAMEIKNGVAGISYVKNGEDTKHWYTANSNTTFIVATSDPDGYDEYTISVYQGIKNVPDIGIDTTAQTKIDVAATAAGIAKVVYIEDGEVSGLKNVTFIRADVNAKIVGSINNTNYYELNAYQDGEAKTLRIKQGSTADHKLIDNFGSLSQGITAYLEVKAGQQYIVPASNIIVDGDGLVTNITLFKSYNDGNGARVYSDAVADDGSVYFKAAGTDRREAEVVYFGTDTAQKEKGYAYTDDVAVAWYDYKGSFLNNNGINIIKSDPNNRALVVLDKNVMIGVCVWEIDDNTITGPTYTEDYDPWTPTAPGYVTIRYYDLNAAQLENYVKQVAASYAGVAVRSYNAGTGLLIFADGSSVRVTTQEVFKVTDGTTTVYGDRGATTVGNGKLANGTYLAGSGSVEGTNATKCVVSGGNVTLSGLTADVTLKRAYAVNFGAGLAVDNVATSGLYVVDGTSLTVKTTGAPLTEGVSKTLLDGTATVGTERANASGVISWTYKVDKKDVDLKLGTTTLYTVKVQTGVEEETGNAIYEAVDAKAEGEGITIPAKFGKYFFVESDTNDYGANKVVQADAGAIYTVDKLDDVVGKTGTVAGDQVIVLVPGVLVTAKADSTGMAATLSTIRDGNVAGEGYEINVTASAASAGAEVLMNGEFDQLSGGKYKVTADDVKASKTFNFTQNIKPEAAPEAKSLGNSNTPLASLNPTLFDRTNGTLKTEADITQEVVGSGDSFEVKKSFSLTQKDNGDPRTPASDMVLGSTIQAWGMNPNAHEVAIFEFVKPSGMTGTAVKVWSAAENRWNNGTLDTDSSLFMLIGHGGSGKTTTQIINWSNDATDAPGTDGEGAVTTTFTITWP